MRKVLVLCAAALLLLRFFDPGLAPFIFDEPFFQYLIDWHRQNHVFPRASIPGNAGIPYGPTALWVYGIIRMLTARIEWVVIYHAALSTCGVLVLAALLRRHFGRGAALGGLLLMASSPLLYFYSRLLWDNTITIPLSAALLSLTLSLARRRSAGLCLGWGILAALLFNLHLMNTAIVGASALYILAAGRKERGTVKFLALSAVSFLAVAAVYLQRIYDSLGGFKSVGGAGGTGGAFEANRLIAPLSTQVMAYFFPGVASEILPSPIDPGPILVSASLAVLLYRRSSPPAVRLAALCMAATLTLHLAMKVAINHPHYFNPVWAFGFVVVAAAWHASAKVRWLRGMLGTLGILTVLSQGYATVSALRVVSRDLGTREMHYGTAVKEQRRIVEAACAANANQGGGQLNLDLGAVPAVFPYALQYHASHAPRCKGLPVTFEPGTGARLAYSDTSATSAALVLSRHAR